MGNGFQFIDIILFAMIAAFLILRLRSVLGRRDGHESGYQDSVKAEPSEERPDDKVVPIPDRSNDRYAEPKIVGTESGSAEDGNETLMRGIADLRAADPSFDVEDFLVGARVAFEMILGAYASGDRETLENLLSPEVYDNFRSAIDDREAAGQEMEETLVGIRSADIVEAYIDESNAYVTTKYLSEQVHVLRNNEGDVIEGNPNQVTDVVDFWTFVRDTGSSDPNWYLVATRSLD